MSPCDHARGPQQQKLSQQAGRGHGGLAAALGGGVGELIDQDASQVAPFVPVNVFAGIQSGNYWSATTIAGSTSFTTNNVWIVSFGDGLAGTSSKGSSSLPRLVRAGSDERVCVLRIR